MSTAVERIMRERGDCRVFHEPFMYDYYISGDREKFTGFAPEADHPTSFAGIRDMMRVAAGDVPVFFKDMGYYVTDSLPKDPDFAREMHHAFLIRDPVQSVLSYVKQQSDFTLEEVGLEAQWQLYQALRVLGIDPIVMDADQIRQSPAAQMARYWAHAGLPDRPEALSWDTSVPDGWRAVETWHQEVLETTQILPPPDTSALVEKLQQLGAPYTDYVAHHMPFYERLQKLAHQK